MPEYTLTVIDTTQIQQYVFGSNRLAENVGASELVELATRRWVCEALPKPNNVSDASRALPDPQRTLDAAEPSRRVEVELLYAGGGNTVLLFRERSAAVEFTKRLTRKVLLDAPGLELVVAHRAVDWDKDALALVMQETLGRALARKKLDRQPSLPLLGLGVTAACRSTGLVASELRVRQDAMQPVAREIAAKIDAAGDLANARLANLLPRVLEGRWRIPLDFDNLGRIQGEEGYLAVVHADGNGMGRRVADLARAYATPAYNRDYITAIRDFSQEVEQATVKALQATADSLADALLADADLPSDWDYFPFRPIVFGGDDVTFVCNGRYGLALATRYLEAFEEATAASTAFGRQPAFACAGIAIVKLHYPFARAYQLSESLCSGAKKQLRDWMVEASALDWQFAISGITGTLEQIRSREYTVRWPSGGEGQLQARPLLLRGSTITWRTWPVMQAVIKELAEPGGEWYDRRNKVKALRDALRQGPGAVQEFLRTYRLKELPDPRSPLLDAARKTGWDGVARCAYFDPIETMDLYTDLNAIAAPRRAVPQGAV